MPFPATVEETLALGAKFVDEYWPSLAARGWNGYEEHGCGVVLVPWTVVQDWAQRREAGASGEMFFITYATGGVWTGVLAGYDPEQEIVVVFCEGEVPSRSGEVALTGWWTGKRFACGESPPSVARWHPRIRPS